MQRQDKAYVATSRQAVCKDSKCVANAQIKYSYLVLPMQKQKHN